MENRNSYLNIYLLTICVLFFCFVVGLLHNPTGVQRYIFFLGMEDFFADFFNLLRYISERDPYYNAVNGYLEKMYFPLSYLILYPFSQLDSFGAMTLQEAYSSKMGLMSVFIFTGVSVFFWLFALKRLCEKYNVSKYILLGFVLSYPFFLTIERGNLILISAPAVAFFLSFYDSEDRNKRLIAIFSLALAVTLKGYPIVFAFLYFEKKQYKEILLSAIVTILLVFLPFLFFKRTFANIPQFIHNVQSNLAWYNYTGIYPRFSLTHLVYYALKLCEFPESNVLFISNLSRIFVILASIFSILSACMVKNKWLKLSLLTLPLLFFPLHSAFFCALYTFPMIIVFFASLKERSHIFNSFILIVFIILLNPFQFGIDYKNKYFTINYVMSNMALLSLWFILLTNSTKKLWVELKARRLNI